MSRKRLVLLLTTASLCASFLFPMGSAAGGGCHPNMNGALTVERLTDPAKTNATIAGCSFLPDVLYVDPGAEVRWFNKDPVPHSVTGTHLSWGTEDLLQKSDVIAVKFDEEGVYPYYCLLHPGMAGTVVVGDPDPDTVPTEVTTMTGGTGGGIDSGSAASDVETQAVAAMGAPASDGSANTQALALVIAVGAVLTIGLMVLRRRRRPDDVIGEVQAV